MASTQEFLPAQTTESPIDGLVVRPSLPSRGEQSHPSQFSAQPHRRLTSRADVLRQASASLLSTTTSPPAVSKKFSGIHIFPELVSVSTTVFYCSGWNPPYCHYKSSIDDTWTTPPGHEMFKATDALLDNSVRPFLPNDALGQLGTVWAISFPGVQHLEFVPNNKGVHWDKPPHGGNYVIPSPGDYFLKDGHLRPIIPRPDPPALLEYKSVTASSVCLVWNAPVFRQPDVNGYQVLRDQVLVATVDSKTFEYEDRELIGLTKYTYIVKAVNLYGVVGFPSAPVEVETAQPDKPGAVTNLQVSDNSEIAIVLQWQKPFYSGGGFLQVYRIYRDGIPVAFKPCTEQQWESWTDSKVVPQESYIYHVTACRRLPPRTEPSHIRAEPSHRSAELPHIRAPAVEDSPTSTTLRTVTRYASILARLPSAPSKSPPDSDDATSLTEYLEDAIQHRDYEGLVSSGVQGSAITRLVLPRIDDGKTHILMQGFNWYSCEDLTGHYNRLCATVERMKQTGLTMLWLPPPTESVSKQGYMPTRYHNLNTPYGTELELRRLIKMLRSCGIAPMLDFVANHRCGVKQDQRGEWTVFEDPDWGSWAIVSNNLQGYRGQGNQDTGASSQCAPDLDHTNETLRKDVTAWVNWLFTDVGYGALRVDMAPGYATKYQVEYVKSLENPFTVGEYWSGDSKALANYVGAGRGLIAAYDFALYYMLRRSVETGNFWELNDNGKVPGLIGKNPQRAVTFIDNHDTVHLEFVGKFAGWNKDAVMRGCVYILTHPGTPCLFWDHFSDFGDSFSEKLMLLGQLRHEAKLTADCGVYIACAYHGLYAAYVSKNRCCYPDNGKVAVKLGWCDWDPEGGGWKAKVYGHDFCVWFRE